MRRVLSLLAFAGIMQTATALGGTIHPGDILVVDTGGQSLVDINPTTGAVNFAVTGFVNPQGVAIDPQGNIYVSDLGTATGDATIDKVNPTTQTFTVFSGNGTGSGPGLDRPFQLASDGKGNLYVADAQAALANTEVIKIDANGNRTIFSGNGACAGDPFGSLRGLTFDKSGNVIVSAPFTPALFRVDGAGTRTLLSTAGVINTPEGLATDKSGRIVTIDGNLNTPAVYYVDPANGHASVLSDNVGHGSGPAFGTLRGVTLDANGNILATDILNNQIFEIDPTTGNRFVVSGNGVGGTTFTGLNIGIAVDNFTGTTVPEPSTLTLAAFSVLAGLGVWLRRRKTRQT